MALLVLILLVGVLFAACQPAAPTAMLPTLAPTLPPPSSEQLIAENRRLGRPLQALYQVEAAAQQQGWTPQRQRQAGDLWFELGTLPAAVVYWRAAFEGGVRDLPLVQQLAQGYITLQDWGAAADTLVALLALDPASAWANYQLGLILAPVNPAQAEPLLFEAVQAPAFAPVSSALLEVFQLQQSEGDAILGSMRVGLVFAASELWAHAEMAFTHAASIGYPYPEAMAYVGLARDRQGKDGSAWVRQAVELAPDNSTVLYVSGLHLRHMGELEDSLAVFERAVALDPRNPALQAELGTAYRLLNNISLAEYWYQQAVETSGGAPEFQQLLDSFYAGELR